MLTCSVGPTFMVGRRKEMFANYLTLYAKGCSLGVLLASAIVLTLSTNAIAMAKCGPGLNPSYSDVESIYVERLQTDGPNYKLLITRPGEVLFIGRRLVPDVGTYDGDDGSALFEKLVAIIEKRDFYSMQLEPYASATPLPKGIIARTIVDGPDDHVAVLRCGVVTKVETYGGSDSVFLANDPDNPQTKSFVDFVDALQAPILAWPWRKEHRELRPTPTASAPPQ
jgi:hypothetical protein